MIVMRKGQMTLLIANEQGFVDWYVDKFMPEHLAKFHKNFERDVLVKRVRFGRKKALSFDFSDPVSVTHFVTFMWASGPAFYTYPGFKEIIEASYLPDMERVDNLYEVTDEQNMEAMLGADEEAWNFDD